LTFSQITLDENLSICHFIDHAAHCLALDRTRFSAVVISFYQAHTDCFKNKRAHVKGNLKINMKRKASIR